MARAFQIRTHALTNPATFQRGYNPPRPSEPHKNNPVCPFVKIKVRQIRDMHQPRAFTYCRVPLQAFINGCTLRPRRPTNYHDDVVTTSLSMNSTCQRNRQTAHYTLQLAGGLSSHAASAGSGSLQMANPDEQLTRTHKNACERRV